MAKNQPTSDDVLFSGKFEDGMAVELLSSTSLFGRTEVALTINGQIVSGVEVLKRKTGTIEVKHVISGTTKITKEGESKQVASDPMDIE